MEYWFYPQNNQSMDDSELYSASSILNSNIKNKITTLQLTNQVVDLEFLQSLNSNSNWFIDIKDKMIEENVYERNSFYEFLRLFNKNKQFFNHIKLIKTINLNTHYIYDQQQVIFNSINYGIDYILLTTKNNTNYMKQTIDVVDWTIHFRIHGLFKTRIIVDDSIHNYYISKLYKINYDGVAYLYSNIIEDKHDKYIGKE